MVQSWKGCVGFLPWVRIPLAPFLFLLGLCIINPKLANTFSKKDTKTAKSQYSKTLYF